MPTAAETLDPAHAAARTREPAIVVDHLQKTFRLPHRRYSTLKERVLHPFSSSTYDELHAVHDATFSVAQGEFFGIVGRNGSGKSSLLKCLAGIYNADSGSVAIAGRISPFIELGVGFNPELTARDNAMVNAIMLGLSRKQARERFDSIIEFAELEEFMDLPLKNYSSGMVVRLAFAVTVQVDAEVLLIDEVLAVGDAAFQAKCFDQFHRLKAEGKTIVFVTHDMSAIQRFCDRAMLVERGKIMSIDSPSVIARAYNELNFGQILSEGAGPRMIPDVAEIKEAWFEDADGKRVTALEHGARMAMAMEVRFHQAAEDPWFSLHVRNPARHVVFSTGSTLHLTTTGAFTAGETVVVRVELENWFSPGEYTMTPTIAASGGTDVLDVREDLATLDVHGRPLGGVVDIPHTFEVHRS
ncbi:ABC transporter ATP-binding protein [Solirubrobacter deserti]|uniref:ABC transporter ATP-binding protein n=1 Tax=Solirubrobacter deserti TaxID=2282478 RepID=A0ABT4RNX5_9ACTN|nr:ABC transporter ATP-binding protein [Solirubrobacter deserti]MDA0140001.1 ABC transporter ATP-binding protein [Solirubrobacter deserti]